MIGESVLCYQLSPVILVVDSIELVVLVEFSSVSLLSLFPCKCILCDSIFPIFIVESKFFFIWREGEVQNGR